MPEILPAAIKDVAAAFAAAKRASDSTASGTHVLVGHTRWLELEDTIKRLELAAFISELAVPDDRSG